MSNAEVVIRIAVEGRPPRRGVVAAMRPGSLKRLTVRWDDDGSTEDIELGKGFLKAPENSLRVQKALDFDELVKRFTASPSSVFWDALEEYPDKSMTAARLRQVLVDLGLDGVSDAWKSAKKELTAREGLQVNGTGAKQTFTRHKVAAPSGVPEKARARTPIQNLERESPRPNPSPAPTVVKPEGRPTQPMPAAARRIQSPGNELAAVKSSEPTPDAVRLAPPALVNPTTRPLAAAFEYRARPDAAEGHIPDQRPAWLSALAGASVARKPSGQGDGAATTWLASAHSIEVLNAAAMEVAARPEGNLVAALMAFGARIAATNTLPALLPALVRVATVLASTQQDDSAKRFNFALGLVANVLSTSGIASCASEVEELLHLAARVPLTAGGGRAGLIAAVARAQPHMIEDLRVWRGLTWEELVINAEGVLQLVFARAAVQASIVTPIVDGFVSRIERRRQIGQLLSAPKLLVEHIAPSAIAQVFSRVAANEQIFAEWAKAFRDEERVTELTSALEEARQESGVAVRESAAAADAVKSLKVELAAAQAKLVAAAEEGLSLRSQESRQISIDAMRSLAQVAATVEQDAGIIDATQMVRKVHALVGRQGIEQFAAVGDEVAFDSSLHVAPGSRPEFGERVSVGRSGYKWSIAEETLVLVHATVSRAI
ncbi:MAG: hypothetical protein H7288_23505 [Kineosporiaceae bacterium]|nr:hypothetical protein [Aeromicrobium sp.]